MNVTLTLEGSASLAHLGAIRARGADAAKFLHSQLTNDVLSMDAGHARLAGFCSAKGRLQASFIVVKPADDEFLLLCSASVLAPTLKRLSMFVMRAQCKLTDATGELQLIGRVGGAARTTLGDAEVWSLGSADGVVSVRLPDAGDTARGIVIAPREASPLDAAGLGLDAWRWLEVRSGLPTIEAATVEQFVPQMLNYELVGGVDFKKGCYPGQEVVARSQYRGTIKRRMFLFDVDAAATAGQEVFHSADPGQPAGLIANAAPHPAGSGGSSVLAEVKLAALTDGSLHLGSPQGPLLQRAELPYDVPVELAASA